LDQEPHKKWVALQHGSQRQYFKAYLNVARNKIKISKRAEMTLQSHAEDDCEDDMDIILLAHFQY
jgi:hypothetical protein